MRTSSKRLSGFFLLAGFVLFNSGCSTMVFVNGTSGDQGRAGPVAALENEEWHHDGVFGLVEFSPPVDLQNRCNGSDWKSVKIEKTFVNGLASAVVNSALAIPAAKTTVNAGVVAVTNSSYVALPLYDPWTVSFSCGK